MRCRTIRLLQVRALNSKLVTYTTDQRPVLRMLACFVTEEKFLKGVSIYLKRHLYKNSVTEDLWEGIAEASGTFPVFAQQLLAYHRRVQV